MPRTLDRWIFIAAVAFGGFLHRGIERGSIVCEGRRSAVHYEGEKSGNGCEERADEESASQADNFDEEETGEDGAQDRSQRVRNVEVPEGVSYLVTSRGQEAGEDGQGTAHEDRRRRECDECEPESDERDRTGRRLEHAVDRAVKLVEEVKAHRCRQDDSDQDQLDHAVEAER